MVFSLFIFVACSNENSDTAPDVKQSPTPAASSTTTSQTPAAKKNLNVYVNEKYNYGFDYPTDATVNPENLEALLEASSVIIFNNNKNRDVMNINVEESTQTLNDYVYEKWQAEKKNKYIEVGDIKTTSFRINPAEEFTIKLTEKTETHLFTKTQNLAYEFVYVNKNDFVNTVLNSMDFNKKEMR